MITVVVLGTGNLAHHLCQAFSINVKVKLLQVYGRNTTALKNFEKFAETTNSLDTLKKSDVYVIAVNDGAINKVATALKDREGLVVHTAGALPMDSINNKNRGVFYPLQSFSKERKIDFSTIPIGIEAFHPNDKILLHNLGASISNKVFDLSSDKRIKLHVAAVFVNNFVNHLYSIGAYICNQQEIPFEILHPLIRETADKIRILSPEEAQTGPASRNDMETMKQHLEYVNNPLHKKIYQLMSESINQSYEKKL